MSKRLFVAIDLPDSTRRLLADLDPRIRGVRWTQTDQMHLTLGFFAEVSEDVEVKLREKLSAIGFSAFFLPVKGVGVFSSKGAPKIIWIGVGKAHPHLFQIYKRVQKPHWPSVWNRSFVRGIRISHSRVVAMSRLKRSENSYNRMLSSMLEWFASRHSIFIPAT